MPSACDDRSNLLGMTIADLTSVDLSGVNTDWPYGRVPSSVIEFR
jgi:hypothetical protein